MLPVVAIVGKSGSGKTVIMEKLIAELKSRGYAVAAVKHAHQTVELDTPEKDTWRYSQAGAVASIVSSPNRVTIFKRLQNEAGLEETVTLLGEGYDLVLAEGFKQSKVPKIEVCSAGEEHGLSCKEQELCAVICDADVKYKLPRFGRDDIKSLADFIEKEIINRPAADMEVQVNGKKILLKPFVKDVIGSSILAMLGTLKHVGLIRHVIIRIRNPQ